MGRIWVLLALVAACGGKTGQRTQTEPTSASAGASTGGGATGGGAASGGAASEPFVNAFGCDGTAVDPSVVSNATANACTGAVLECELIPHDTLIVLDRSATMGQSWGGSSRWTIALEGIAQYLATPDSMMSAGLQVFSARGIGDSVDCDSESYVSPLIEIAPFDTVRSEFAATL